MCVLGEALWAVFCAMRAKARRVVLDGHQVPLVAGLAGMPGIFATLTVEPASARATGNAFESLSPQLKVRGVVIWSVTFSAIYMCLR